VLIGSGKLFFIGSYRDNEVNALHPLNQCIDELGETLSIVALRLEPLCKEHIEALLAGTFPRRGPAIEPLAELLLQKREGIHFSSGSSSRKPKATVCSSSTHGAGSGAGRSKPSRPRA